jgi:hypothetical protein
MCNVYMRVSGEKVIVCHITTSKKEMLCNLENYYETFLQVFKIIL